MIAILQPFIPHYRTNFFKGLHSKSRMTVFCYETHKLKGSNFQESRVHSCYMPSIKVGPFLFYNPFILLSSDYEKIVLMLNFTHLTTWLILITKIFHKKTIIVWGQGISVKRYLKEERKPNLLLKLMINLADVTWLYTSKEKDLWSKILPKKNIIALNNTISGIERIINYQSLDSKEKLKEKYKIKEEICLIFCARFNNQYRRIDLLVDAVRTLSCEKFGFIIIGDGPVKPDFSEFPNVYDFGSVYDSNLKDDLFSLSDVYFQPGWVGLSIVEALAYGKPIITFERSPNIYQCVEYSYLKNNFNSIICKDFSDFIKKINLLDYGHIRKMSNNSKLFVEDNLKMDSMVLNAVNSY